MHPVTECPSDKNQMPWTQRRLWGPATILPDFDLFEKNVCRKFSIPLLLKLILLGIQKVLPTCIQLSNVLAMKIRCLGRKVPATILPYMRRISYKGGFPGSWRCGNLLAQGPGFKADDTVSPYQVAELYPWPPAQHWGLALSWRSNMALRLTSTSLLLL